MHHRHRVGCLAAALALAALLATLAPTPAGGQAADPEEGTGGEIIGGTLADPGEYPYQVALLRRGVADRWAAQFCGGSLISPDTVLTAGHCVVGTSPSELDVLAGTTELRPNGGGRRVPVRSVWLHPGYGDRQLAHDIAVLQLAAPLPYAPVRIARPADIGRYPPGTTATVTGWGDVDIVRDRQHYPRDLREVEVPIVSDAACQTAYQGTLRLDQVVCAGDMVDGGEDSCQGDSGGPLVVLDGSEWLQVGVVSTGTDCARRRFPGIYSEVARYPFVRRFLDPDDPPDAVRRLQVRTTADGPLLVWQPPVFDGGLAITHYRVEVTDTGSARQVRVPWAGLGQLPPGPHRVEVTPVNALGPGPTRAITVTR